MIRFVLIFFFGTICSNAQTLFSVDYKSQSDINVFVVDYKSQADLLVYKVDYKSQAKVMMDYGTLLTIKVKQILLYILLITNHRQI